MLGYRNYEIRGVLSQFFPVEGPFASTSSLAGCSSIRGDRSTLCAFSFGTWRDLASRLPNETTTLLKTPQLGGLWASGGVCRAHAWTSRGQPTPLLPWHPVKCQPLRPLSQHRVDTPRSKTKCVACPTHQPTPSLSDNADMKLMRNHHRHHKNLRGTDAAPYGAPKTHASCMRVM